MALPSLLFARQSCVTCPDPPPCNCPADQQCFQINRDCSTCGSFQCVPLTGGNPKHNDGISTGALTGAIVGSLIVVIIAFGLFFWYRRRSSSTEDIPLPEKDVPASAATVLNRPDPMEKLSSIVQNSPVQADPIPAGQDTHITSPPDAPQPHAIRNSSLPNPFDDQHSIQTAGTEGTNVIPIALVTPANPSTRSDSSSLSSSGPIRPLRSPELNLNLDHVNVSRDSLRPGTPSVRSGISVASSRMSYMSGASEFLREAPMIVTPTKASVRQVLGVVKAEVIQAPGTPSSAGLKAPQLASRPPKRSPLASQSFGPADIAQPREEEPVVLLSGNPFGDEPEPRLTSSSSSLLTSSGYPTPGSLPYAELFQLPRMHTGDSRPASISSQAASIVDITSATRVYLGPPSTGQTVHPQIATGKLMTPSTARSVGTLEEQQQRALAHAQAQAQAQGLDPKRRVSGFSVLSAASTHADSILEAFPFVPPSPISDRPVRSPPLSPQVKQGFNEPSTPRAKLQPAEAIPLEPPQRHVLGMSTASQLSVASSVLGSFPFQIESMNGTETTSASSLSQDENRASLDTVAITTDLSSHPLPLDDIKTNVDADKKLGTDL